MRELVRDVRTWVAVVGLAAAAVSWVWNAGGETANIRWTVQEHERRLVEMDRTLRELAASQSRTAANLEVLTALFRSHVERTER